MQSQPLPPLTQRLPMLDAARGLALVAMIIFHGSWNLDNFGFTDLGVVTKPGWAWFAKGIAGSFLMLSGLSLVLADAAGHSNQQKLQRIGKIAAAAALVSIGTYIVFPRSFVYFGILHHLALASLLALPLLRTHWSINMAIAMLVVGLDMFVSFQFADTRWLAWTGLATTPPFTNDYVPLMPWFAVFLCGIPLGRQILKRKWIQAPLAKQPSLAKPLVFMGRHSLIIYLLHQPILFGAAYGVYQLIQP
ncbi:MAG: hypothetical protein COA52_08250 [Hyphomicrobiales bacterium]|nr:MAG: hypothetical protein COA52_08250 [Hyphomicrobiales bacterium]